MKPKAPTSEGKLRNKDKASQTNEKQLYKWAEEAAVFESKPEQTKSTSQVKDLKILHQSEKKVLSIKPPETEQKLRVLKEINEQNSK